MSYLLDYLDYVVNTLLAPREYFQYHNSQEPDIRKGALIALTSSVFYGVFTAVRSVISVSFGEVTLGITGRELLYTAAKYLFTGSLTLILSTAVTFTIIHVLVKIMGYSGWKKTFNAITYATPVVFLSGAVMIGYQIFETLLIGFPLLRYLGLGGALFYAAYVQARGLEIFHDMSFRRALMASLTPAVASVILSVAAFLFYMSALTSTL